MSDEPFSRRLGIDDDELRDRRAYFDLGDEELARLRAARPVAEKTHGGIVEDFYEHLMAHSSTRRFFTQDATLERVKSLQTSYFLELFDGQLDRDYVERRLRIGAVHERIGLDTKWYLGAYRRFLELSRQQLKVELDEEDAEATYESLLRLVFFDMSLAVETFIATHAEAVRRHQEAIRELSTPVISVHQGVLLLPIVGTVDSMRAEQIMEAVLVEVGRQQARVLILDIAGVAVVDTDVAHHLLQTTAAVGLLGAEVVLTGISPEVARTLVRLGIEIASMHTRSSLADGIDLALSLVGLEIRPQEDDA